MTNYIVGFRDNPRNPDNPTDFNYANIDYGVYIHDTESVRLASNVGAQVGTLTGDGVYDIMVAVECITGDFTYKIEEVAAYNSPMSDFSAPDFEYVEAAALGDSIWYHISLGNTACKIYDVWEWEGNKEPVVDPIEEIAVYCDQTVTIEISAYDTEPLSYSIDDPRFSQTDSVFEWTPVCSDVGTYYPVVTVSDGCLDVSVPITVRIVERGWALHDPMSANNHGEYQWHENGVIWHPDSLGYVTGGVTNSWYNVIISDGTFESSEDPFWVFRFDTGPAGSGKMFGLTDTIPPLNDHHYSNMAHYIYVNAGGSVTYGQGPTYDYTDLMLTLPSGLYDLRIQLDYPAGKLKYDFAPVASIGSPVSDFNTLVGSGEVAVTLESSYYLQMNMYTTASKIFDVWTSPYLTPGPPAVITTTSLRRIYPNPFNPATTIQFNLEKKDRVQILIYNVAGKLIKKLVDKNMVEGQHEVAWNGKDETGKLVSSGIYFCLMKTEEYSETKKMVLLR